MNKTLIYNWYEQYKNGIYRYALSILKNPHSAEDVLQETFLRLLSGKYVVREDKIESWLYRVARNYCYDILRKQQDTLPILLLLVSLYPKNKLRFH